MQSAWEDHEAEENERYKEEIAAYLAEHPEANKPEQKWKPDFRQSKNLKKEQLTSHDCKEGVYDEHLRQALGLPDYDSSEFRDGS